MRAFSCPHAGADFLEGKGKIHREATASVCVTWAGDSHVHLSCSSHGHKKGGKVVFLSPSMLGQRGLADKKSGPSSSRAEVTLERRKKEAGSAEAETEVP